MVATQSALRSSEPLIRLLLERMTDEERAAIVGSANAQGSAAGALHAIAIVKEEHQRAVMTGGGIAPLVKLLRFGSSKVQEEVGPKPVRPPPRLGHPCTIPPDRCPCAGGWHARIDG